MLSFFYSLEKLRRRQDQAKEQWQPQQNLIKAFQCTGERLGGILSERKKQYQLTD